MESGEVQGSLCWQKAFPNNASPYYSLPAFVVRAGNPKNIKNWDILRPRWREAPPSGNAEIGAAIWIDVRGGADIKARQFVYDASPFWAAESRVSAFANLPISRKLVAAFAAVVVIIFVSGAFVYDRLLVIEGAKH